MSIKLKRVYEPASDSDGYRILVDRLWPRGLAEENAHVDLWLRRIAPTTELRKWYGHDPTRFEEFRSRYLAELDRAGLWDDTAVIVCTDVSDLRLDDLCTSFADEAQAKGLEFICLNPTRKDEYQAAMARLAASGFDDIIVNASRRYCGH